MKKLITLFASVLAIGALAGCGDSAMNDEYSYLSSEKHKQFEAQMDQRFDEMDKQIQSVLSSAKSKSRQVRQDVTAEVRDIQKKQKEIVQQIREGAQTTGPQWDTLKFQVEKDFQSLQSRLDSLEN